MITGLDHITVNMADREASFTFYEEVLGLEKIYGGPQTYIFLLK